MRFSLRGRTGSFKCGECDGKKKKTRNCQNHQEVLYPVLLSDEWNLYPPEKKPVEKIYRTKFFACPVSTITQSIWEMIRLANACLSGESDAITTLPFSGGYLDQPHWFREAIEIIRNERAEARKEALEKMKKGR